MKINELFLKKLVHLFVGSHEKNVSTMNPNVKSAS